MDLTRHIERAGNRTANATFYWRFGKRWFDIGGSLLAGLIVLPLCAIVGLCVVIDDGRPILFRQVRIGTNGNLFVLLKFRSMPIDTPEVESVRAKDLRTTRIGKVIRRTSLDELPQLANVLRGEMSLVGPRPPLVSQILLIEQRRANGALQLRPGITGLAQVEGFDGMSVADKAALDGLYSQTMSFRGDCAILAKTVGYLIGRQPTY